MIKTLLSGIWVCAVTAAAIYAGAAWQSGRPETGAADHGLEGLEHRKTKPLNVPMIADGAVQGYIIAQFIYTIDGKLAKKTSLQPEVFVTDEAFRAIYGDEKLDFRRLEKFDLNKLTHDMTQRVNARMNVDMIKDVLIQEFNYVAKSDIQGQN